MPAGHPHNRPPTASRAVPMYLRDVMTSLALDRISVQPLKSRAMAACSTSIDGAPRRQRSSAHPAAAPRVRAPQRLPGLRNAVQLPCAAAARREPVAAVYPPFAIRPAVPIALRTQVDDGQQRQSTHQPDLGAPIATTGVAS